MEDKSILNAGTEDHSIARAIGKKTTHKPIATGVCLLLAIAPLLAGAQVGIDEGLLKDISAIKAIDNHAHPLKYVPVDGKADNEYDALPVDAVPAFPLPFRLRVTNTEFIRAWHELYEYPCKHTIRSIFEGVQVGLKFASEQ